MDLGITMKLYIKSNSQFNAEAFNRIQQSLVLGKKDRQEVVDYLDNLYDEDKLTEEEYDKLYAKAWESLEDATPYDNVKSDCPLAVTFSDTSFDPIYSIYDVSCDDTKRYALLNERQRMLEELSESNTNDPNYLYDYVKCILDTRFSDLNDVFVEYTEEYNPLKR